MSAKDERNNASTLIGGEDKKELQLTAGLFGRLGTLNVYKGRVGENNMALFSWDFVPNCIREDCSIGDTCNAVTPRTGNKCGVMRNYLKSLHEVILSEYHDRITQSQMFRAGMELIPLYRNLCRLKIVELGLQRTAEKDSKGIHRVHPIFKEIRETIRVIEGVWRSTGLQKADGLPDVDDNLTGDHYADLSAEADEELDENGKKVVIKPIVRKV